MAKILIVDDDPDIRGVLRMALSDLGEVVEAVDGLDALEKTTDAVPDVAVLDVMMPRLSGLDTLTRWRAEPSTSRMPVVVLTARDREPDRVMGYRTGADAYLTKPFDVMALRALVEDLLSGRPTETTELLDVLKGLADLE